MRQNISPQFQTNTPVIAAGVGLQVIEAHIKRPAVPESEIVSIEIIFLESRITKTELIHKFDASCH